jgi:hypothetical protein
MIQAYPARLSVLAGATLTVHIGTDQGPFLRDKDHAELGMDKCGK